VRIRFRSIDDLVGRYTSDIARGGIFAAAATQLPIDTEVELLLELPGAKEPLGARARVAYVVDAERAKATGHPPGMGLAILGDTGPIGDRIAEHVAHAAESEPAKVEVTSLHVLVVEDSASYRSAIEAALVEGGHRVTLAEHGLGALSIAVRDAPDLVLSDVNMPAMDGWQLLRVLRSRAATRKIPVVFLTMLDSERDRIRGFELGVDDYVGKPFVPQELVARVVRAWRWARAERADDGAQVLLRGELERVSVASLLSFLEAERRSGVVVIRAPSGQASIHLAGGRVTRVDLPSEAPASVRERLLAVLDRTRGRFHVVQAAEAGPAESISITECLLEHARRIDERGEATVEAATATISGVD
jgi:DNA-binding response OmpR family regulator